MKALKIPDEPIEHAGKAILAKFVTTKAKSFSDSSIVESKEQKTIDVTDSYRQILQTMPANKSDISSGSINSVSDTEEKVASAQAIPDLKNLPDTKAPKTAAEGDRKRSTVPKGNFGV